MAQPALAATAQSSLGADPPRSRRRRLWIPALICGVLLGVEIYALVHDIGGGAGADRSGQTPIATFESGKNQVRQKNAGTIIWNSPEPGQTLFRQDAIATMPDSQAVVKFKDASEMIVEADSLIVFEDASFPKGGTGGKIIARLVRGSIRRKDSGPLDLFVKFSDAPDAKPYRLSDSRGGAIFRVSYSAEGIEVTVESGGLGLSSAGGSAKLVSANQTLVVRNGALTIAPTAKPVPRLPFPNLKKPRIEIRKIRSSSSLEPPARERLLALAEGLLGIAQAHAAESEPRWMIEIHFAWDSVPGASSYLIQIARDPSFTDKVLERNVSRTDFEYRTPPPANPEKLYMRVAGVDASGNVGEFSPLELIHIRSLAEISGASREKVANSETEIKVVPVHRHPARHRRKANPGRNRHQPEPGLAKESKRAPRAWALEASYGVVYQSRSFSSSDLPSSVSSSGFVPALVQAEYVSPRYRIGGSYLFEVANAGSSGATLQNGKIGTPLFRGWFLFENLVSPLAGWQAGVGPYLTDSSGFSWSGTTLDAQTKLLGGVLASAIKETKSLQWRLNLGILGLGGFGADASVTARRWVFGKRSFFAELGAQLRMATLENSYGGSLGFGKTF